MKNTKTFTDEFGTQFWLKNNEYHRTDGPAIIWKNGSQEWYINDKRHRTDGPAIIWKNKKNGSQEWYINDKRHRTDGPAKIGSDGSKFYWLNGVQLTEQEFNKKSPYITIATKTYSKSEIKLILNYFKNPSTHFKNKT